MPRTLKITLSYDGTDFHGWQVQPGLPTIQGELERVLAEIESAAVPVTGSGRTDAGVHALGQVVSFDLQNPIPASNLRKAMNRLLPPAIRVLAAEEAVAGFHARRAAVAKTYEYRLWRAEICPPTVYRYVYHHPYPLDFAAMQAAAPMFEGTRDFRSLAGADDTREQDDLARPRTIFTSRLEPGPELARFLLRGNGFLRHMVRNLVGTLLEVGKGNIRPEEIAGILEAADRQKAGPTAPPQGLFLLHVEY